MVSALASGSSGPGSSPGRRHSVQLCSWARHFTLTAPLFTQGYKWVPANLMLEVALRWTSIPPRGRVEILLVTSCCRNRIERRPDEELCLYADFT